MDVEKAVNGTGRTVIRHPLDSNSSGCPSPEPESLLEVSEVVDIVRSPDTDEDLSVFQAVLSPDTQDVWLTKSGERRKIIPREDLMSRLSSDFDDTISQGFDSPDELEDSILEKLDNVDPIAEYTAEEEREDVRSWRSVKIGGTERSIDMKVIEPYKRVLSHGGYLSSGSRNAIVVFSACFLPNRGRVDYNYVMDNLFAYILSTLDQLVTDDYLLVYLHGGAPKDCIPTFAWLKKCYKVIDRKLRKNLKHLYLVHPTFWLKTIVTMTRPFVSSKFYKKMVFINSLSELFECLPLEEASIPERVCRYDRIKQSIQTSNDVTHLPKTIRGERCNCVLQFIKQIKPLNHNWFQRKINEKNLS